MVADKVHRVRIPVDCGLSVSVTGKRAVQTPFTREQKTSLPRMQTPLTPDPLDHGLLELPQEKVAHIQFASLVDTKMT